MFFLGSGEICIRGWLILSGEGGIGSETFHFQLLALPMIGWVNFKFMKMVNHKLLWHIISNIREILVTAKLSVL